MPVDVDRERTEGRDDAFRGATTYSQLGGFSYFA